MTTMPCRPRPDCVIYRSSVGQSGDGLRLVYWVLYNVGKDILRAVLWVCGTIFFFFFFFDTLDLIQYGKGPLFFTMRSDAKEIQKISGAVCHETTILVLAAIRSAFLLRTGRICNHKAVLMIEGSWRLTDRQAARQLALGCCWHVTLRFRDCKNL
jgi:hypothetical protein